MIVTRFDTNVIPNTEEGKRFADTFEKDLKERGLFVAREDKVDTILIRACVITNVRMKDNEESKETEKAKVKRHRKVRRLEAYKEARARN